MSLLTGKLIKARSFTHLPMPGDVIKQVEDIGTINIDNEVRKEKISPKYDKSYSPKCQDDIRLQSNNYSNIIQSELADIIEDEARQYRVIPESPIYSPEVLLHNQYTTETVNSDIRTQGVGYSMETDEKDDFEHLLQIESVEDDTMDDDVNVNDAIILDQNDVSNLQDKIEENNVDDMDEIRTTHVTRSGRHVKMRKDLFDNYEFTQQQTPHLLVYPNIETISTQ
jgi:hypothetical protein